MENLLISACLLGVCCRYDGGGKRVPEAERLARRYHLIPVCPEQLGGMPTPRVPSERAGEKVVGKDGTDVTAFFAKGAEEALRLATFFGCKRALLKERSPSCGAGQIYDGSFTGGLARGDGVLAEALQKNGIRVYGESNIQALLEREPEKSQQEESSCR